MKKALLTIIIGLCVLIAQGQNQDSLKSIVRMETETFMKRDTTAWKNLFVQNEKTNYNYILNGYCYSQIGWNRIVNDLLNFIRKGSATPSRYTDIKQSNYVIASAGLMASVIYDQTLTAPGVDSLKPVSTREIRTLLKDAGQWKINSVTSIDTLSFSSTQPESVENMFNAIGYNFLKDKKIKEAINIFKFNTSMYPGAWNTYDSLGEAYIASGDKKLAILNYEKSIKLNPKNDNGIAALKKLKQP